MLMSVRFKCLCNLMHRKLRWQQIALVNDIHAHRGNACLRICMPRCFCFTLQGRAPLQAQNAMILFWLDRESSYKILSQLALDLLASPASQAYVERLFSLCGDLTARKWNRTRQVFLKLNCHILH